MGVCETRWKRSGDIPTEDHQIIYAGRESHGIRVTVVLDRERARCVLGSIDRILLMKIQGRPFNISIIVVYTPTSDCNEEEIYMLYDNLDMAKAQCKSQEIIIVMGGLNTKVGSKTGSYMVGKHGLGMQNEPCEQWLQWYATNSQVITNTWFKHYPRRLWTWKNPGGNIENQIDYITINMRFLRAANEDIPRGRLWK